MENLITISQVAKELGLSYHVARNHLNRCVECAQYKTKLDHTVVYDKKVLEILRKCEA